MYETSSRIENKKGDRTGAKNTKTQIMCEE